MCDVTNPNVTNITKNITNVSSEEKVKELLNDENWNAFLTFLPTYGYGPTNGSLECVFRSNISEVFLDLSHCPESRSKAGPPTTAWEVFLVLGLISILGNLVVIGTKFLMLLRNRSNSSEEFKIFYFLVLNLSSSDLLMGIYLTAMSFDVRHKIKHNYRFSETNLCNAMGILNFVSSQVTITILVVISGYRLYGVVRPFKRPNIKVAIILCAVIWILWLAAAILPALDFEPWFSFLAWGVAKDMTRDPASLLLFYRKIGFNVTFTRLAEGNITEFVNVPFSSYKILLNIVDVISPANANEKWMRLNPYQAGYFCAINYVVASQNYVVASYILLGIILYDCFCCVFILIAYGKILSIMKNCCNICEKHSKKEQPYKHKKFGPFLRITIIIATNLLCWIPLCLSMFVIWSDVGSRTENCENSHNVLNVLSAISLATLCLVSCNSVINPYIYSMNLWKKMYAKIKHTCMR